jgi:enoyl-CoA hydratase/carnithine racemase
MSEVATDAGHDVTADAVLIDEPAEGVRRFTINRPEKRNALNHAVRGGILNGLQDADRDPSIRVSIVRGAGSCFSAGYDLGDGNVGLEEPTSPPTARATGRGTSPRAGCRSGT